jgi:hypothetical protein
MSETPNHEIKLNDLMFLALDHAVDSVRETADLLIPFIITEKDGDKRFLNRFVDDRVEQGVEKAKKFIEEKKEDFDRYAIAWDGFVTIEGTKWEAILVEAGDKIGETGILLCQRYQKKNGFFKKGIETIGNAALVGRPVSRIK